MSDSDEEKRAMVDEDQDIIDDDVDPDDDDIDVPRPTALLPWTEKYRPKTLNDIAHQDDVVSALKNCIATGNVGVFGKFPQHSHPYLWNTAATLVVLWSSWNWKDQHHPRCCS